MRKLLLLPALLLAAGASPASARDVQYVMRVDGLVCPFCVATSEKALRNIDGVRRVTSDLKDGTITVCADADKVAFTDAQLTELFRSKGFTYRGMAKSEPCDAR